MIKLCCLSSTLLLLAFACTPKVEVVKAGAAIGHENVLSVGEVMASAQALKGKSVRISGTIQNVCQQKGCWMELAGDKGESMRITTKDYGFFFPKGAAGQK